MAKIICKNAKVNKVTPCYTELSCDRGCQICHGAGYTEEAVVKVSEVTKWAEQMANTKCGSPAMPYEQGMSRAGRLLLYWLLDKEIEQEAKG